MKQKHTTLPPTVEEALDRNILPVESEIVPDDAKPENQPDPTVKGAVDILKRRFSGTMGKH